MILMEYIPDVKMLGAIENDVADSSKNGVDTFDISETNNEEDYSKSPPNVAEVVFDSSPQQTQTTDISESEKQDTLITSEKNEESEERKSPISFPQNNEPLTEIVESNLSEDLNSNSKFIVDSDQNNTPLNLSEFSQIITHNANDLFSKDDDILHSSSSRCRIYERLNKKINYNFRGLGENSLSIRGVNNLFVPYTCRVDCNFASVSLSALKIHTMLKHSGDDFYSCTFCGERFVCDDSLLEHVCKQHYDYHKIAFKCNIKECFRSFQRINNLKQHLLLEHKGSELVPCSFCYRESYSLDAMINHIRSHLKHTLRCAYCYVTFASKEKTIKHINSCHVGFLRKINLHVEVTNNDRLSKQDSTKYNLKLNSFNGEDSIVIGPVIQPLPYQCHSCSYTCNDNDLLKIHIKEGHLEMADNTNDFSCNFCNFSTNNKESIKSHLCFHTNAKFLRCYSCPYCTKQCNNIDIIENHLHSHHPSEGFKFEAGQEEINYLQDIVACPFCIGIFKWKSNLCAHFSNDHHMNRLADYLMFQCKSNASKSNLILPKELLTDRLDSAYNSSNVNEMSKDDLAFKCIKCDFKHSNYNVYNEHVKSHYEMFDTRENTQVKVIKKENPMLFVCKLCPFQCNKSLNFKRHSAIHEKAKNLENCFKCGYCMFRHNRINCIKFHLGKYHEKLPIKVIKITNGEEFDVTESEILKNTNPNEREEGSLPMKRNNNKPPNEYFDSFLPRGMIFAQPVKCPTCDYANRVRINLIRHMRQHVYEDLVHPPTVQANSFEKDRISEAAKKYESPPRYESLQQRVANEDGDPSFQMYSADGVTTKKLFKCAYCDVVSKWNRRDVSLHILHVHLQKKVYTCNYCDYGSRKSSQMVRNHSARVHPGKPVIIKDELALFNSVVPLRDGDGVITVAYVTENGAPILTLEELGVYLKLDVRKNKNELTLSGNSDKEEGNFPPVYESKPSSCDGFNQDIDEEEYPKNLDNSEEWKCIFCGLQMFSEVMMKRHVMCHHMKLKPYSCRYCKAQYWQKQSIENHINSNHPEEDVCYDENVKEKACLISKYMQKLTNVHRIGQPPCKKFSSIYHCRICGYQDQRHDKAKYHVVKKHLKIGLYSCSKCHQYMGGKGRVENHIQEFHPDSDAYVLRSYDIHALFLQKNIKKIGNFQSQLNKNLLQKNKRNNYRIKYESVPTDQSLLTCRHCNYIAESEASLGAHSRVHKIFECYYCNYQNNLLSRVQSHCLIRHPTKPIKHRQIAPIDATVSEENANSDSSATYEANRSPSDDVEFPQSLSPPDSVEDRSMLSRNGQEFVFKCKLCNYNSDKATVIRHHIMSHLLYHPYQCPYCNLVCSVKSSPITKHIQLKHPDKEIRFICKRDEQMERQVKNSFEKISLDTEGNVKSIEVARQDSPVIKDEQHFADNQRIYYKCCFCALITPIRTDMKHHLMRELKYKPFSCAYCHYEEPCRSKMGKHFRIKHQGMTISIKHSVNAKKELEVFEYLQKCTVKNYPRKTDKHQDKTGHIPIIRISNLKNVLISSLHYRGKVHKCSQCCFKTSNIKAFVFHRNIHNRFKLKCSYCQYANKCIFMLRKHMKKCCVRNCRATEKLKQTSTEWLKALKRSVRHFARKVKPALKEKYLEGWTCSYCHQKFQSRLLLREHLQEKHSIGSRSLWTSSMYKEMRHRSKMHQRNSYNLTFCCSQCNLKFSTLEDFGLHLQTHYTRKITFPTIEVFPNDDVSPRLLRCGFCSFQTTLEEEFVDHVSTHTVLHPIKCKYCLFATFTSSDMKQHFELCHPNQDVRFDGLSQPYTMTPSPNLLPNFKPVVKLVDLKFCLT